MALIKPFMKNGMVQLSNNSIDMSNHTVTPSVNTTGGVFDFVNDFFNKHRQQSS